MLKLNIGLSRKVGEANYGSRGASVNLEMELDSGMVREPDRLQENVRYLFRLARAAVDEELNGGRHLNDGPSETQMEPAHRSTNGQPSNGRQATQSQVRAIHAIANRQGIDLAGLLRQRYGLDSPTTLSIRDASDLIDSLKSDSQVTGGSA